MRSYEMKKGPAYYEKIWRDGIYIVIIYDMNGEVITKYEEGEKI